MRAAGRARRNRLPRSSTRWTQAEQRNCEATSRWRRRITRPQKTNTNWRRRRALIRLIQWTVLANFYLGRQRWFDLDTAINNCVSAAQRDKHPGIGLYDGAGVLIAANRNPQLAATMLEDYLAGSSKSEEAPAFIAYARLGS